MQKPFKSLTEREILALAIQNEEEDGRIYGEFADALRESYPATAAMFEEMRVPVTTIRLGGGGARSDLWRQIQADVYAHEVEILQAEEGAAYGAALLAGVAAKFWNSVEEACDAVVKVQRRVTPQPQAIDALRRQYQNYRQLYPALKSLFNS